MASQRRVSACRFGSSPPTGIVPKICRYLVFKVQDVGIIPTSKGSFAFGGIGLFKNKNTPSLYKGK
ncbi:MAG: hypothetical protein PHI32_14970 [Dysgonamonadaceae bacterium]|nr:hypothetical protein [Dysgonamonadaceae bacterium]